MRNSNSALGRRIRWAIFRTAHQTTTDCELVFAFALAKRSGAQTIVEVLHLVGTAEQVVVRFPRVLAVVVAFPVHQVLVVFGRATVHLAGQQPSRQDPVDDEFQLVARIVVVVIIVVVVQRDDNLFVLQLHT